MRALLVILSVALGLFEFACSEAPSDARIGVLAPSNAEDVFGPVAEYLGHRCGTIDCHGNSHRNLRIYSCQGLRFSNLDVVECSRSRGGRATTPDEHQATFRSLVSLEPTLMSEVVAGRGLEPELLTFYRKARGIETHTGGQLVTAGDDQDVCLTSWLGGQTNLTACANAFQYPSFQGFPSSP
jgi:hypothetical protein